MRPHNIMYRRCGNEASEIFLLKNKLLRHICGDINNKRELSDGILVAVQQSFDVLVNPTSFVGEYKLNTPLLSEGVRQSSFFGLYK